MHAFTKYVAAWMPYILVESSTGTIPSVTGLFGVTRMSVIQWVTTRALPLCCIKATRYTALAPMIRARDTIKVKFWDVDMLLAASLMITFWKWTVLLSFLKEKQLCCENSFYFIRLKRNNCVVKTLFMSIVKEKQLCCKNSFCVIC